MKRQDIETFFATLQAANPHPKSELEYRSDFELLAAVLLSVLNSMSHQIHFYG